MLLLLWPHWHPTKDATIVSTAWHPQRTHFSPWLPQTTENIRSYKISITFDRLRELWDKGLCSADTSRQVCLTTLRNKKEFLHLGECELPLALFHTPCLAFDKRFITVFHNNFGGPVLLSSGKEEASGQRGRSKATLSLYFQLCAA